ncbi:TPA: OB-fold nucleic acid binding domain-containing protein [Streptococcus suis]|nr:OB-fold nucleic acid binding domain-containing protein [Streptococcus suis]
MRNQNNLQKINRNTILARGKIIEINNDDNKPSFTLFIRNGAGRKHTYLKCYFNREKFQLKKGMVVSISGHIENINTKNCYEIIIDTIQEEQTELAVFFNKKPSFGFAYPNHFAKMFVLERLLINI